MDRFGSSIGRARLCLAYVDSIVKHDTLRAILIHALADAFVVSSPLSVIILRMGGSGMASAGFATALAGWHGMVGDIIPHQPYASLPDETEVYLFML